MESTVGLVRVGSGVERKAPDTASSGAATTTTAAETGLTTHGALLLQSVATRELLLLEVAIVAGAVAVGRGRAMHAASAVVTVNNRGSSLAGVPLLSEATAALDLLGVAVG